MRRAGALVTLPCLGLAACTTLGPMPATTGASFAPAERTALEVQVGLRPGYYLSSTAEEEHSGTALPALAGIVEPGAELVPGLIVGAGMAGDTNTGASLEPLLGYRAFVDGEKRVGLGVIGSGTHANASNTGASFSATRAALEVGTDVQWTPNSHWLELHTTLGIGLTALSASGRYCVGVDGRYAVDCPSEGPATVEARVRGLFPVVQVGVGLDTAQHLAHYFQGVRLSGTLALGTMPTVVGGEQRALASYLSGGVQLTFGFGAPEKAVR